MYMGPGSNVRSFFGYTIRNTHPSAACMAENGDYYNDQRQNSLISILRHCDVCHSEIVQKTKEVWYLRITEYADKLLQGLEEVEIGRASCRERV